MTKKQYLEMIRLMGIVNGTYGFRTETNPAEDKRRMKMYKRYMKLRKQYQKCKGIII